MKLLARRTLSGLVPCDAVSEEALLKLKLGTVVQVEVKKARNPKHHRLYWALIGKVFENQERYETVEQLHNAIKLAAGIYTVLEMPNGTIHKIPGSISFDDMDQTSFKDFWNRVCDLIAQHFLPGVTQKELKDEVESMIGLAA